MKQAALARYQDFAEHLSSELKGDVLGYEAYYEPNLWSHLGPQTVDGANVSIRLYFEYLKSFSAGVRAGDPAAKVIAGATAPTGANDVYRTSPQSFARALARAGAAAYFDVYSHHPYVPGGAARMDPALLPVNPAHTVSL